MKRLTRRCKVCNRNYKEDQAIVLDNERCTSCIIEQSDRKMDDESKGLIQKADEIIKEIDKGV